MKEYEVIVVGGGHAGIEASIVAAKMGCNTALITMEAKAIGRMSCNPAIGGTAKGHLVHEIDALGGVMGIIADKTGIQFKILNKSKGPAVWSSRCQSDRELYSEEAYKTVKNTKNLTIIEDIVDEAIAENNRIVGIKTQKHGEIKCKALIIASGTFLKGLMFTGFKTTVGGRVGEPSAEKLSESFIKMGLKIGRLKTGTPARLIKDTIDFDRLKVQSGDEDPQPFSMHTDKSKFPFLPQIDCYITYTNPKTHAVLRKGFDRSPLFTGIIKGKGPRYCPSIEDKIVRFANKDKHQLFLEPEGLKSNLIYLNGFSSSLPEEIQIEAIHTIEGLEKAEILRPGYAIEYDFILPYQLDFTLETKKIKGLYFAGQVNGTSGYEEAAAQGIVAGINAALKIQNRGRFTLRRDEAYIGVLIDDLINKETLEPYRMFTSRAEHRLLLRQDNADRRLLKYGYKFGLISKEKYEELINRERIIKESHKAITQIRIKAEKINNYLKEKKSTPIQGAQTLYSLCKRPELKLKELLEFIDRTEEPILEKLYRCEKCLNQVEIEVKYEGYIKRQLDLIEKFKKLEEQLIPEDFDYNKVPSLSNEGREKLIKIKPRTLGQASRISGVRNGDISILMIYLKQYKYKRNKKIS